MSDVDRRELERCAAQGDVRAQRQIERLRCRSDEHCGCRIDLTGLYDEHWLSTGGIYDEPVWGDDLQPRDEVNARVSLKLTGHTREALLERLSRLLDKLGLPQPPPLNEIDRECGYCKAKPGDPCLTKSGKRAKGSHAVRVSPPGMLIMRDHSCYDYADFEEEFWTIR